MKSKPTSVVQGLSSVTRVVRFRPRHVLWGSYTDGTSSSRWLASWSFFIIYFYLCVSFLINHCELRIIHCCIAGEQCFNTSPITDVHFPPPLSPFPFHPNLPPWVTVLLLRGHRACCSTSFQHQSHHFPRQ